VQPIARKALGPGRPSLAALAADWPAVVGEETARAALPERLSWPRGERTGGVLELRVEPAAAVEIQHDAPRLIERVNAYLGHGAVDRLRLVQAAPRPAPPAAPPLGAEDRAAMEAELDPSLDPEWRARLALLGEAIWRRTAR
jgi:hypothetical protein